MNCTNSPVRIQRQYFPSVQNVSPSKQTGQSTHACAQCQRAPSTRHLRPNLRDCDAWPTQRERTGPGEPRSDRPSLSGAWGGLELGASSDGPRDHVPKRHREMGWEWLPQVRDLAKWGSSSPPTCDGGLATSLRRVGPTRPMFWPSIDGTRSRVRRVVLVIPFTRNDQFRVLGSRRLSRERDPGPRSIQPRPYRPSQGPGRQANPLCALTR